MRKATSTRIRPHQLAPASLSEALFAGDHESTYQNYRTQIPVAWYLRFYEIKNPKVCETIRKFPTLCFSLGKVREDSKSEIGYLLEKGSGMYALKHQQDAEFWQGIFNHIMGTTRQVFFLSQVFNSLDVQTKKAFADYGKYDLSSFAGMNPKLLREYMLASHVGRRAADEVNKYKIVDQVHRSQSPDEHNLIILEKAAAPIGLNQFMKDEERPIQEFPYRDIVVILRSYCDWTFGQNPTTLQERFDILTKGKRLESNVLHYLQDAGEKFEAAIREIIGPDILEEMLNMDQPDWEKEIRECYWLESG